MPTSLINDMERPETMDRVYSLACDLTTFMSDNMTLNTMNTMNNINNINLDCLSIYDGEHRGKKSQNTTECVPVPSSEHVAEIVGRQGCKIKALRAKTNTYIKTPVRGEEPVFVVTGRKEDVCAAKKEICSAAEHFSQIRAQRKNNLNGTLIPGPNSNIPGQKTIQVRVPYRVVGLVVGPKGATIKRIQQTTNTYIVTPSRDKEPVFDVTGLPENVESARKEIEAHIAMRTGGSVDEQIDDYNNSNALDSFNNLNANLNSPYFKNDLGSNMMCSFTRDSNLLDFSNLDNMYSVSSRNSKNNMISSIFNGYSAFSQAAYDADDALSPTFDSHCAASTWPDYRTSSSSPEGDSNSLFNAASISTLSDLSSQRSNSLTGPLVEMISGSEPHQIARRTHSDPLNVLNLGLAIPPFQPPRTLSAAVSKCTITSSRSLSPESLAPGSRIVKRDCMKCNESEVVAALVPCGHNNFCMECAEGVRQEGNCPICHSHVNTAMRILY